jgi:hypothetical protein
MSELLVVGTQPIYFQLVVESALIFICFGVWRIGAAIEERFHKIDCVMKKKEPK